MEYYDIDLELIHTALKMALSVEKIRQEHHESEKSLVWLYEEIITKTERYIRERQHGNQ